MSPPKRQADAGGAYHRSVDAAGGGRRGSGLGSFGPLNSEVSAARDLTARRAAYLATNNQWIANGVANWTAYLAGTGARPTARGVSRQVRRAQQRTFDKWAELADHAGRTDFWGLQSIIAHDMVVHGEALVILHDGSEGLQLQVIPPDHLDAAKTGVLADGRMIVQGVEFDAEGRRVAYWIHPDRPHSTFTDFAPSVG